VTVVNGWEETRTCDMEFGMCKTDADVNGRYEKEFDSVQDVFELQVRPSMCP